MFRLHITLLVVLVFSGSQLLAENKKASSSRKREGGYVIEKRNDGTTVKYKERTKYDFEGLGIEGLYNKPSGSYISNIKDVRARSIIKIRKDFDAEVVDSYRMVP